MSKTKINIGDKYNRLTVIQFSHKTKNRNLYWFCDCECGTKNKIVHGTQMLHGKIKSCGCLLSEISSLRMQNYNEPRKLESSLANLHALYSSYKNEAKRRNYNFAISLEDFKTLTKQNCYYCDIQPKQIYSIKKTNGSYAYNGIDRIDNSIGYILENCVPCCKICNRAKDVMSQEIFLDLIKRIYERHLMNE